MQDDDSETGIDWEDALQIASHIPGGAEFPALWAARAAEFRNATRAELDIPYGPSRREMLDLFHPRGTLKGLVIFVHGGFWRRMDKSLWSHLAAGPLARGWAVAIPGYTLTPEARIAQITTQIGAALGVAAAQVAGPIRLAGHSAGGHLVTRMICTGAPIAPEVQARIAAVVSISGVHDLRPLRLHSMNADLRLDADEAAAESPVLLSPLPDIAVTCWTGANERPEFLRQTAILAEAWSGKTDMRPPVFAPGQHHFDVIDGLTDADSALTATLLN
jgi:arylformamidase